MDAAKYTQKFIEKELIGQGGFGKVFKALNNTTGKEVAIKKMNLTTTDPNMQTEKYIKLFRDLIMNMTINEINITKIFQKECATNFVICYNSSFRLIEEDGEKICLELELLQGFALNELLPILADNQIERCKVISNLCKGLIHIHAAGVLHKDIKPENIYVDPDTWNIKYFDFGLSCVKEDPSSCKENSGTEIYKFIPPGDQTAPVFNEQSDKWGLAITILDILRGHVIDFKEGTAKFIAKVAGMDPTIFTTADYGKHESDKTYIEQYNSKNKTAEAKLYYINLDNLFTNSRSISIINK